MEIALSRIQILVAAVFRVIMNIEAQRMLTWVRLVMKTYLIAFGMALTNMRLVIL